MNLKAKHQGKKIADQKDTSLERLLEKIEKTKDPKTIKFTLAPKDKN